jgi:hypothetical protein
VGHTVAGRIRYIGKKKSASSGHDPATFRLVAWCLNQLRDNVTKLCGRTADVARTWKQKQIPVGKPLGQRSHERRKQMRYDIKSHLWNYFTAMPELNYAVLRSVLTA